MECYVMSMYVCPVCTFYLLVSMYLFIDLIPLSFCLCIYLYILQLHVILVLAPTRSYQYILYPALYQSICLSVCMYINMCVYIYIGVCVHLFIYLFIYVFTCVHVGTSMLNGCSSPQLSHTKIQKVLTPTHICVYHISLY